MKTQNIIISSLFIKSPTLILTADHSTFLFPFSSVGEHTGIHLHDPPPFNGPFFMTPPFSES